MPHGYYVAVVIDHFSRLAKGADCPANQMPRLEPRSRWPMSSQCAEPRAPIRGHPGAKFKLQIAFLEGRKHLPIVELKQVA